MLRQQENSRWPRQHACSWRASHLACCVSRPAPWHAAAVVAMAAAATAGGPFAGGGHFGGAATAGAPLAVAATSVAAVISVVAVTSAACILAAVILAAVMSVERISAAVALAQLTSVMSAALDGAVSAMPVSPMIALAAEPGWLGFTASTTSTAMGSTATPSAAGRRGTGGAAVIGGRAA